jgi:TATA-binding protein-associated factor
VKPFILRRTKDRVLADLPPKILQDVYVDASPLQRLLYQDFDRSEASQEVQGVVKAEAPPDAVTEKTPHVFQVCCCSIFSVQGCQAMQAVLLAVRSEVTVC